MSSALPRPRRDVITEVINVRLVLALTISRANGICD